MKLVSNSIKDRLTYLTEYKEDIIKKLKVTEETHQKLSKELIAVDSIINELNSLYNTAVDIENCNRCDSDDTENKS